MVEDRSDNGHCFEVRSPLVRDAYGELEHYALHGRNCIIFGPTGCGKEYAARHYHAIFDKTRPNTVSPFVALNCSCLTRELAMSELFGHVRGAFTGALHTREGAFVRASGGVLFLDEIGDLQAEVQAYLLRALGPDGTARALGSDIDYETTGVTVVCATERLPDAIRPALLSRLQMQVFVPGMAERQEDIPGAVSYFVRRGISKCMDRDALVAKYTDSVLAKAGKGRLSDPGLLELSEAIGDVLVPLVAARQWPGNFRALGNAVDAALVCADRPDTLAAFRQTVADTFSTHADRYSTLRGAGVAARIGPQAPGTHPQGIAETHPDLLREIAEALPRARNRTEVAARLAGFFVSNSGQPFTRADLQAWFPEIGVRAIQKYLAQGVEAGILSRSGKKGQTYCYSGQQLAVRTDPPAQTSIVFPLPRQDDDPQDAEAADSTMDLLENASAVHVSGADAATRSRHVITMGHRLQIDHPVYYLHLSDLGITAFLEFVESQLFAEGSRKELQQAAADLDDGRARVALCASNISDGFDGVSDAVVILDGIEACYGGAQHLLAGWMVRLWPSITFILAGPKLDNDLQDAAGQALVEQTLG